MGDNKKGWLLLWEEGGKDEQKRQKPQHQEQQRRKKPEKKSGMHLGLRVESGVLDEGVDEDPQLVLAVGLAQDLGLASASLGGGQQLACNGGRHSPPPPARKRKERKKNPHEGEQHSRLKGSSKGKKGRQGKTMTHLRFGRPHA